MSDFPRLIEHAYPLTQASFDSVHEENARHGHISTLHIWPVRRPLASASGDTGALTDDFALMVGKDDAA